MDPYKLGIHVRSFWEIPFIIILLTSIKKSFRVNYASQFLTCCQQTLQGPFKFFSFISELYFLYPFQQAPAALWLIHSLVIHASLWNMQRIMCMYLVMYSHVLCCIVTFWSTLDCVYYGGPIKVLVMESY